MNDEAWARIHTGCECLVQSRVKAAVFEFEQAKMMAPKSAAPYYYLGHAYLELGDKKKALLEFEHAAHLDPNDAWTYLAMGNTHLAEGNLPAGTELLNMAGELPSEPGVRLLAGGYLAYNAKKYQEALDQFNAAAEWLLDWPCLAECTALALYHLKRNQEACTLLRQAARHPLATASTFRSLGMAEKRLGNHKEAAEAYERAYRAYQDCVDDNPLDQEALLILASLDFYFRRWRLAWDRLKCALRS